jgi:hypothetical protein
MKSIAAVIAYASGDFVAYPLNENLAQVAS